MPLHNIGLTNFRALKDQTQFKFAPITVITGTNSSGKSSILDAIRIFQKYFDRSSGGMDRKEKKWDEASTLKLDDLIPRISSLSFLGNKASADSSKFSVCLSIGGLNIDEDFLVTITFKIKDNDERSCVVEQFTVSPESLGDECAIAYRASDEGEDLVVNFKYFIDAFEKELRRQIDFLRAFEACYEPKPLEFTNLSDGTIKSKVVAQLDYIKFYGTKNVHPGLYNLYQSILDIYGPPTPNSTWPNLNAHRQFASFRRCVNEKGIPPYAYCYLDYLESMDFSQIQVLEDCANPKIPFYNYLFKNGDENLLEFNNQVVESGLRIGNSSTNEIMSSLESKWLSEISTFRHLAGEPKKFGFSFSEEGLRLSVSESPKNVAHDPKWNLILKSFEILKNPLDNRKNFGGQDIETLFQNVDESNVQQRELYYSLLALFNSSFTTKGKVFFEEFLYPQIERIFTLISIDLNHDYVPSIRSLPQRFFFNQSTFIGEVIARFLDANPILRKPATHDFIKRQLIRFGIGEDISIEYDGSLGIQTIHVVREGNKINLLDLGFGILQFIPLLLQISITAAGSKSKLILVEEPETNLHPALQSKLADMFVEASREFKIQFIIESHSEYLIRKLQYLTRKGDIAPDKTQIYYCYSPKDVPEGEPQVKKINILDDGSLSDDFGQGFFDEADNIAMSIWNLNNAQKN